MFPPLHQLPIGTTHVPAIALTAHWDDVDRQNALKLIDPVLDQLIELATETHLDGAGSMNAFANGHTDPFALSNRHRLDHVLNVGMVEVGTKAKANPVTHWKDKRNTVKKLAEAFKNDMEKKVPKSTFMARRQIAVVLDIGLMVHATISVSNTLEITVDVTGKDYNGDTVQEYKVTYSALPTSIKYDTFVDVVVSSIAMSLEKLLYSRA